jgi:pimeloyl-ACP methyl ester carboxylesterase
MTRLGLILMWGALGLGLAGAAWEVVRALRQLLGSGFRSGEDAVGHLVLYPLLTVLAASVVAAIGVSVTLLADRVLARRRRRSGDLSGQGMDQGLHGRDRVERLESSAPTKEGAQMSDETGRLTVVLVHGAFADASSWNGVIERLQAAGMEVTAPPNPLRGISIDSAYIASVLEQIPGPVLLVGHSYGGAVITNAATGADNVVGLVYVAAFAPDEGELLGEVEAGSKDSVLNAALVPRQYPSGDGGETAVEFAIDPAKVREAFAADLSAEGAGLIAAGQRPVAELAFSEPSGPPAWKSLPSWAVVATGDKAAGADVVRSMAERAGATITEAEGSHVIMISQPDTVVEVITTAAAAVGSAAAAT